MKLQAPKAITFWIAVVLAVLGLIGEIFKVPFLGTYAFWFELVAFVLLVLGVLISGL